MKKPKDIKDQILELYPRNDITIGPEAMLAYCHNMNIIDPELKHLREADEAFVGEYATDLKFAYDYADSVGLFSCLPANGRHTHQLEIYFDWEKFSRDLMYDHFEVDGFYFRNV